MIETILIIFIIALAVVATNFENRRKRLIKRENRKAAQLEQMRSKGADPHTLDLIGAEAYQEMTDRIDQLLERHKMQPCISVRLTCGPDTAQGAERLHKILPGEPVALNLCTEKGVQYVDVYSQGVRMGRLALMEDMLVRDTMETNHIRGAYVAEQNCYKINNSHDMGILIFYEPKLELPSKMKTIFNKAVSNIKGKLSSDICNN